MSGDLLGNDVDPDGDGVGLAELTYGGMAYSVDLQPTTTIFTDFGTLVISADGFWTFTPNVAADALAVGEVVSEQFTYVAVDQNDELSSFADFKIEILGVNDGPIVLAEYELTDEDTPVPLDVLANDADPDGDDLEVITIDGVSIGGPTTAVGAYGTLVINPDESAIYTPGPAAQPLNDGDSVTEVFTYVVSDEQGAPRETTLTIQIVGVDDDPEPTATPTVVPATSTPTVVPATSTPTVVPATATPTVVPATSTPTPEPTPTSAAVPTAAPTSTVAPTSTPTPVPTIAPTPVVAVAGSGVLNSPSTIGSSTSASFGGEAPAAPDRIAIGASGGADESVAVPLAVTGQNSTTLVLYALVLLSFGGLIKISARRQQF